uniref:Uncharacterized protein n=1 Tax=Populus trichocarpa TaxID=3694 RepID=A0A2K2A5F5_POPTR
MCAIFLNQSFFSARDKNRNLSINRFDNSPYFYPNGNFLGIQKCKCLLNLCFRTKSSIDAHNKRSKTYVFLLTKIRMQIGTRDKRVCYMSKPLKTKVL